MAAAPGFGDIIRRFCAPSPGAKDQQKEEGGGTAAHDYIDCEADDTKFRS